MSNLIQIKVAELNQLNPLMIAEDNRVEQKFIQMYNAIWGTTQGAQIYEKEKFNFRKILQDKPELQKCTPLDRKSTRQNSSHSRRSRMPSSA